MKSASYLLMFLSILILLISGCNNTNRNEQMVLELLEKDREFSRNSAEIGAHQSFLAYIDDNCALLRPNRAPVIGREKITEMFSKPDTSFTLTWEPMFADISASGDLGYTYGIYTVQMDSPEGTMVTREGTYVTIWKKDKDGEWKFVLDTGNQGLDKKQEKSDQE